ncbi:MAG TPA: sugar ABC transporter permease [Candidatus Avipropionibacterium avicola]|uniref:Sugar ABC transporter permease n=1 Tax=Candidatus Avipropionibacterium avicola TaxID=2840701 RepID=A0A9D1H0F4_9ACTN|nr:sugar ABC transporter permease [Candidatus Avipropionibacterium avicola]
MKEPKPRRNALSDGQGRLAAILLSPTMVVLVVIVGIPLLLSLREAFFGIQEQVNPQTGRIARYEYFAGLENFTRIFSNPQNVIGNYGAIDRVVNAFLNTTFFTIICIAIETVLGVAMALVMSKAFRGRAFVRAGILIPWAIPTIVSAMMWNLIFNEAGVMNRLLDQHILWTADGPPLFWAVVIADVWKTAPFIGLLTLAGLQTIPAEVYEAAKVDGASAWQSFTRITLPMVKPALVVAVLFRTLDTMRMFDLPAGLGGFGKYSAETLSMLSFMEAREGRYGPAAAYSIILFLFIVLVSFLFVKFLGADVINDEEVSAIRAQRKRQRSLHRKSPNRKVRTTVTSGDMP